MKCSTCDKVLGKRHEVLKGPQHKLKDCIDEIIAKTKKVKTEKERMIEDIRDLNSAKDRDRWSREPESKYYFNRVVAKIKDRESRGLAESGAGNDERLRDPINPFLADPFGADGIFGMDEPRPPPRRFGEFGHGSRGISSRPEEEPPREIQRMIQRMFGRSDRADVNR